MENKEIHGGHRQRLKEQFLKNGLDGLTDIQALELLLFFAIPRIDTNPVAHALLNKFGSLSQVLEAPVSELKKVSGIGENAATLLHMITPMSRRYLTDREKRHVILETLDDCGKYLVPYFHGRLNETVFLLCLDGKRKVLSCSEMGEGSINSASVSVRKIVETAISVGATAVILAHNHPSGIALPSQEDILVTRRIAAALAAVEIILADHIVVAEEDYVSMIQSGIRFDQPKIY